MPSIILKKQPYLGGFTAQSAEDEQLRDVRWTNKFVMAFAWVGGAFLLIYSAQLLFQGHPFGDSLALFGAGGLLALASLMAGALAGFIFGIPRSLRDRQSLPTQEKAQTPLAVQSSAAGSTAAASVSAASLAPSSPAQFQSNTNLEDISDWLTKIIVGLGLTKLAQIPGYVKRLTAFVTDVGRVPNLTETVAFSLMASFSVCGFFMGYLMTRLFLQRAFDKALAPGDRVKAELTAAAADPVSVNPVPDMSITDTGIRRAIAVQKASQGVSQDVVKELVRSLAKSYESLRLAMSPGYDRTNSLEQVASQMKSLGLTVQPFLGELKTSSSPGERLAAVTALEISPRADSLDWLADRIIEEQPFIGYHAALALRAAVKEFLAHPAANETTASGGRPPLVETCQAIAKAAKYLEDKELRNTDRYDVLAAARTEAKCQ